MAGVTPMPLFRVGEKKNNFNYYGTQFESEKHPVFRCIRGHSDDDGMRLYLFRAGDGHWIAVEAHAESKQPISEGRPVFRTLEKGIDDISQPIPNVPWQWWDPESKEWHGNMTFNTYDIRPTTEQGVTAGAEADQAAAAAGQDVAAQSVAAAGQG